MKLSDLAATFVRIDEAPYTGDFCAMPVDTEEELRAWAAAGRPTVQRTELRERSTPVETFAEAQGLRFRCPKCLGVGEFGPTGHSVMVAFAGRGVPDHLGSHGRDGRPSRWTASGTGLHDLVLSPSIDCGCWHGFVGSAGVPPGEAA